MKIYNVKYDRWQVQQIWDIDCSEYGEKMLGGGWGQYSKLSNNYGTTFSNTYTSGNYFGVAINKLQ